MKREKFFLTPNAPCFCSCHRSILRLGSRHVECFDCKKGLHVPGTPK